MAKILANIGDYFAFKIGDGRYAYAQYLYNHELYASLVRVLDLITQSQATIEQIRAAGDLFPPVFVGVNVPIRGKLWCKVGSDIVLNFSFPLFRCRQGISYVAGKYYDWLLWDGVKYLPLGELPVQYRRLEYLAGWSSDGLERRILTGINEPYDSMI